MTALYTPARYSGQFITLAELGDTTRLTCWQFGRPQGHREYRTWAEAVATVIGLGLVEAGEAVKCIFEMDVLVAAR